MASPTERYRAIGDLPGRIPLFPLRGAIVLPRSDLPLNVFEPRYLAMVDDALSGNRIIGVIQPEDSHGPGESPEGKVVSLKKIGCACRITAYQEMHDNTVRIALSGIARFTMKAEPATTKPYRLADADYAPFEMDIGTDQSAERIDRGRLLKALKAYIALGRISANWETVSRAPLEPLVNNLAAMCPFGPEEKQALLEAPDVRQRADVLITLAEMAAAAGGANGGGTLQ